jgi:hypothetical protein
LTRDFHVQNALELAIGMNRAAILYPLFSHLLQAIKVALFTALLLARLIGDRNTIASDYTMIFDLTWDCISCFTNNVNVVGKW